MATPSTIQLCNAARRHDLTLVSKLLKDGADINSKTLEGDTVLHIAAAEGFEDLVEYLLGHYARPNPTDKVGRTPLHVAAAKGRLKICQLLVEHRAKIAVKDDLGSTPIQNAADAGHKDVVKYLKAASGRWTAKRLSNFIRTISRR